MRNFDLGNLAQWARLGSGEVSVFDAEPGDAQKVRFDVLATSPVIVSCRTSEGEFVVCQGEGLMRVKFTCVGPAEVFFDGGPECQDVLLRRRWRPQVRPESFVPSFATIEPRGVGPSDPLRRMMHMVRLNMEQRDREVRAEVERLGSKYEADRKAFLAERKAFRQAQREAEKRPKVQPESDDVLE